MKIWQEFKDFAVRGNVVDMAVGVIIGTAFGYSDTFLALSKKYPEVAFLDASGTTNGPNLQSFYGRTYESQYLCGMVAGAVATSSEVIRAALQVIGPHPGLSTVSSSFIMITDC